MNNRFYKGYVPGKQGKGHEKEPCVAYTKPENHMTWEQCSIYPNVLGILADDVILLDADSEPHSSNLIKIIDGEKLGCMVTNREAGRGIHALLLNDTIKTGGNGLMLACGVVVDIKLGCKNGLECAKFRGVERISIHNEQPYQIIPKYLYPLKKCDIDFAALGEGDGRNDTLYAYILTLQNNGFTVEEIKQTIKIINKYVLKKALPENEIETILRDAAFRKKSFFNGKTFLHDKFAEHIKAEYHVRKINGQLHIYDNGVYVPGYMAIEKVMIKEIQSLTDAKRKEVLKYLDIMCDDSPMGNPALIPFKNGLLDIEHFELSPFSPELTVTNMIPWEYNPAANCFLVDTVLERLSCGDAAIRALLEEVGGVCMYRSNEFKKAFMLVGEKNNGKSTFISLLQTMLGADNVSNLDFRDLDSKFSTAMLYGKLANLGDDISDCYKDDISTFKKISSGDVIKAEEKGQRPFNFKPYAKLIFSANNKPRINDPTGAGADRFIMIPLNARFSENDSEYDPQIRYKLAEKEAVEYFIQLSIKGLRRVLSAKKFTFSEKAQAEKDAYEKENNPILAFIEEIGEDSILNEPTKEVFKRYEVFCAENGFRAMSNLTFSKRMNQALGTVVKPMRFGKKLQKVFVEL